MNNIKKTIKKYQVIGQSKVINLECYSYFLEIYKTNIVITFGHEKIFKYNELFGHNVSVGAQCVNDLKLNNDVILMFETSPIHSMVAHECVHACDLILQDIGYMPISGTDEINAYLVSHLFDVVMQANELNNKK